MKRTRKLWLEFEGGSFMGHPVRARMQAPARGPFLRVTVQGEALEARSVYVLLRKGQGDLIVGASADRAPLEVAQQRLGAERYDIIDLPVVP
jgi:hypothetical protein